MWIDDDEPESPYRRWTLSEARMVIEQLDYVARPRDFAVLLAGSLRIDNVGRDLDLVLMATKTAADAEALLDELPRECGWTVLTPNERTDAVRTVLFVDDESRLIDVTVVGGGPPVGAGG